jgi:hypothetical protein
VKLTPNASCDQRTVILFGDLSRRVGSIVSNGSDSLSRKMDECGDRKDYECARSLSSNVEGHVEAMSCMC